MEAESARLPRYGARLRCPACNALLAPALPEPSQTAPDEARVASEPPAAKTEAISSADAREEARAMIRAWLAGIRRNDGQVWDEPSLLREHGRAVAEMMERWRTKHPDDAARSLFREVLFDLIDRAAEEVTEGRSSPRSLRGCERPKPSPPG
jgi:hypothetical protein